MTNDRGGSGRRDRLIARQCQLSRAPALTSAKSVRYASHHLTCGENRLGGGKRYSEDEDGDEETGGKSGKVDREMGMGRMILKDMTSLAPHWHVTIIPHVCR